MFCAVGDVGGAAGEVGGDAAQGAQLGGVEQGAVAAHAQHEELVVELLLLEHRGLAAVEAGSALGVEAHPAEPAAQVGRVDRVEAALGVDVEDPGPDVERVVVLLGLLVLVQRLGVAEGPLALATLGTGAARAADAALGRGAGLRVEVEREVISHVLVVGRPAGVVRTALSSTLRRPGGVNPEGDQGRR